MLRLIKPILLIFILIFLGFSKAIFLGKALEYNNWAIVFLDSPIYPTDPVCGSQLTLDKPRAAAWQAQAALEAGNTNCATSLLMPWVTQGEVDTLHVWGQLLVQGNKEAAIKFWESINDQASLYQFAVQSTETGELLFAQLAYQALYRLRPAQFGLDLAWFYWDYQHEAIKALEILNSLVIEFPHDAKRSAWYRLMGGIYRQTEDWIAALAAYQSCLQLTPNDSWALEGLGWTMYLGFGDLESAMRQFERAIEANIDSPYAYYAMASILSGEQRYKEADVWYEKLLAVEPKNWYYFLSRGNNLRDSGDLSQAIFVYEALLTQNSRYAPAYYEVALAYLRAGQNQAALEAIHQAVDLMAFPNANYYLRSARIHEAIGDFAGAEQAYRQVLNIDPNNQDALKALEHLQQD